MCIVKTPKVSTADAAAAEKDPIVVRNPYLDGVGPAARAQRSGRSSLRIVRGTTKIAPSAPPIATRGPSPSLATTPTGPTPVRGGVVSSGGRISNKGARLNAY